MASVARRGCTHSPARLDPPTTAPAIPATMSRSIHGSRRARCKSARTFPHGRKFIPRIYGPRAPERSDRRDRTRTTAGTRTKARLFQFLASRDAAPLTALVFLTSLTLIHAGLTRLISVQLTGVDYPWYFQSGLAAQYILGFGFQPSVAGVFLVLSIVFFLEGYPFR